MKQQQCLLCGQEYPAGLNVMGCLLCFPCERKLLATTSASISRRKRHQLLRFYGAPGVRAVSR